MPHNTTPPDQPETFVNSWRAAEENAARWMRHAGFTGARLTGKGPDAGIDIVADSALAQVKYQAHAVGRPALQRLFGARGHAPGKDLLFFTGSTYSATAVEYANTVGMALFTYDLQGHVTGINDHAKRLEIRSMNAQETPSKATEGEANTNTSCNPPPPQRSGWVAVCSGSLLLWGVIGGLFNADNFNEESDILPAAIVAPTLLIGGILLVRLGVRRLNKSNR